FIRLMIDYEESGLFFPQNEEYVRTSELVKTISKINGKKIRLVKTLKIVIKLVSGVRIVNKIFGNLVYEKPLSSYDKANYQIRGFRESIELTESRD
ncbi:MAG: NAD-dependent epimerase, partial [bacterium]